MPPEGIFHAATPPGLDSEEEEDQEAWSIDRAIKYTGSVVPPHNTFGLDYRPMRSAMFAMKHYVSQSSSHMRTVDVLAYL